MSNNNVNNNQPNNPYGQPLIDNKQNKFLRFLNTTPGQSSNTIVKNQRRLEKFKIGNEEVTVPEEYAEAFKALHEFWYNDMLDDYLKGENNGYSDSSFSSFNYLKDWKNEIDFFLKNLATACTKGDLSPEYLNILVYNENFGIIHLRDWLVPFCRSCVDKDGILKEQMCELAEEQGNNSKCPDYICQTQQNWQVLSDPITHEAEVVKRPGITPFPDRIMRYQNEGANFLLKIALEKYLENISKSSANSELSTKELQAIIYNFKIASEQCRQGLHHNANNTLINQNTTDIPYGVSNDNSTVTKSDKNIGALVGGVLGAAGALVAAGVIYGGCRYYKEEGFLSSLKHTWNDIKSFFGNGCKKKGNNETNKRDIKNKKKEKKDSAKSRNEICTVTVNNGDSTSKGEFIGKGNDEKKKKKVSNINDDEIKEKAKELEGEVKNIDKQQEKKTEDGQSVHTEDEADISLSDKIKNHLGKLTEAYKDMEQNQAEIDNNNNINLDKKALNEYLENKNEVSELS